MQISTSTRRLFSQCRLLGSGSQRITLTESEMFSLFHLSLHDLEWDYERLSIPGLSTPLPFHNYYQIPLTWFQSQGNTAPKSTTLLTHFANAIQQNEDFGLYYHNLCSLHKRRLKYQKILSTQPKPNMDQIGPRSLLEYGICDSKFLFSWMTWRKWIFDIDNRAAQETGYLFEPVLASCLGGESVSGLTPILLVLDPTQSSRLSELSNAFQTNGGHVFIGEEAWNHMDQQAGEIMSVFLEKYIRPPLATMSHLDRQAIQSMQLNWTNDSVLLETNDEKYEIPRID